MKLLHGSVWRWALASFAGVGICIALGVWGQRRMRGLDHCGDDSVAALAVEPDRWIERTVATVPIASAPSILRDRGQLRAFARSDYGHLIELNPAADSDDATWILREDLGPITESAPAAVADDAGGLLVFFRDANGELACLRRAESRSQWEIFEAPEVAPGLPKMAGAPAAIVADTDGRQVLVFFRAEPDELWVLRVEGERWTAERAPHVQLKGSPTAVFTGEVAHVFFNAGDDHLWVTTYHPRWRVWKAPEHMGRNDLGCDPSATLDRETGEAAVYYCGPDGHLFFTHYPNRAFDQWWSAPHDTAVPVAAIGSAATGPLAAAVYFRGPDDRLHVLRPDGGWLRRWTTQAPRSLPHARWIFDMHAWPRAPAVYPPVQMLVPARLPLRR